MSPDLRVNRSPKNATVLAVPSLGCGAIGLGLWMLSYRRVAVSHSATPSRRCTELNPSCRSKATASFAIKQ